jgi:hypothetical protein
VAPTATAEIVFKVTSDPLEAHFVASALLIASKNKSVGWPVGIVRYENIVQLEGSYRRRPVFGLWREEAYDVGALLHAHRGGGGGPEWFRKLDAYSKMNFEQLQSARRFKDWAGRFKESTDLANRAKLLEAFASTSVGRATPSSSRKRKTASSASSRADGPLRRS